MKKYHIKLNEKLYAESEEAALKLAIPLAKVEEINPTSEGGAGGGGWKIRHEDNAPNPIVEISGGGGTRTRTSLDEDGKLPIGWGAGLSDMVSRIINDINNH
jgi:hypothetical protein